MQQRFPTAMRASRDGALADIPTACRAPLRLSIVASMRSREVRPVVDADSQSTYQSSTMIDHIWRAKVQADVERART
jgi:hypothetical protein